MAGRTQPYYPTSLFDSEAEQFGDAVLNRLCWLERRRRSRQLRCAGMSPDKRIIERQRHQHARTRLGVAALDAVSGPDAVPFALGHDAELNLLSHAAGTAEEKALRFHASRAQLETISSCCCPSLVGEASPVSGFAVCSATPVFLAESAARFSVSESIDFSPFLRT